MFAALCFGLSSFRYQSQGPLPVKLADRQREAARLAAHFETLDAAGRQKLKDLGGDAFEQLLAAFLQACHGYDAKKGASQALYNRYYGLARVIDPLATRAHGVAILDAYRHSKPAGSERPYLLAWVARTGNPDQVVPLFLKEIPAKMPDFEMYDSAGYVARTYIARSNHPLAVRFMLGKLNDPKADATLRQEAYWRLAGTGGEAGLKAVLAHRRKRALLKPIAERMDLLHVGKAERDRRVTTLVAERRDAKTGRIWALLQCGILGSGGDLWLAEKVGGTYQQPLFTGVSLDGISRWNKTNAPEPKIAGKTAKELAAGAWFTILVGNQDLARDSDGDGLTDLVEARLGTDPRKADTDGDGDLDGVDPWPNVAARPSSDAEKALAAAFEARYWGSDYPGTALMSGAFTPFEMPGWPGPVLFGAGDRDHAGSLSQHYEQGIAMLRISSPGPASGREDDPIRWNKNHAEAIIRISTYYGGLNGTGYVAVVRKFGDDWVVVSMDMEYIS